MKKKRRIQLIIFFLCLVCLPSVAIADTISGETETNVSFVVVPGPINKKQQVPPSKNETNTIFKKILPQTGEQLPIMGIIIGLIIMTSGYILFLIKKRTKSY